MASSSAVFAGVAEGRMAKVVGQRQRLGEVLVEVQNPADRACDLRHLEAVGETGAVVVALVVDEDLRSCASAGGTRLSE